MKRTYSDIEATAAGMSNYSRTFSPYDRSNLGGYQSIIMAHSNAQPDSVSALNPVDFNGPTMSDPMGYTELTNPRITNPARVYASFSLDEAGGVFIEAPRLYDFSFMFKSMPVAGARADRQSTTQRNFNANAAENLVPVYAVNPFCLNVVNTVLLHKAAKENYKAYAEITGAMLYHGLPSGSKDLDNRHGLLLNALTLFKQFNGITCIDGVTMANEPYNGRESFQGNMGNTIFSEMKTTIQSYHSMTQTMKGMYQMYDYWDGCGTFPNAALYFVWRKFAPKDGNTIQFFLNHPTSSGFHESRAHPVDVSLPGAHRRYEGADLEHRVIADDMQNAIDATADATRAVAALDAVRRTAIARTNVLVNSYNGLSADMLITEAIVDEYRGFIQRSALIDGDKNELDKLLANGIIILRQHQPLWDAVRAKDDVAIEAARAILMLAPEKLAPMIVEINGADGGAALRIRLSKGAIQPALDELLKKAREFKEHLVDLDDRHGVLQQTERTAAAREAILREAYEPHPENDHPTAIWPLLCCAVAIPDNGPLPRKYLRYEDEDGRKRYGNFVFVGTLMRPSYFKQTRKPLKPRELTPLVDARLVNTKNVIHVRLDPDDSFHTVI